MLSARIWGCLQRLGVELSSNSCFSGTKIPIALKFGMLHWTVNHCAIITKLDKDVHLSSLYCSMYLGKNWLLEVLFAWSGWSLQIATYGYIVIYCTWLIHFIMLLKKAPTHLNRRRLYLSNWEITRSDTPVFSSNLHTWAELWRWAKTKMENGPWGQPKRAAYGIVAF